MQITCPENARQPSTLRRELFGRTLILGRAHLRAVLAEYREHYNTARPHRAPASCGCRKPAPPGQMPAGRGRSWLSLGGGRPVLAGPEVG
jgi:hypothetical protein